MRFVTAAVAPSVGQNELIVRFEGSHIAGGEPHLQIRGKPVVQHQWRPIPLHLVADADSLTTNERHISIP